MCQMRRKNTRKRCIFGRTNLIYRFWARFHQKMSKNSKNNIFINNKNNIKNNNKNNKNYY